MADSVRNHQPRILYWFWCTCLSTPLLYTERPRLVSRIGKECKPDLMIEDRSLLAHE